MVQKENSEQINLALARIIDSKDHYTAGHSERVAELARRLAEHCRLPRADVERPSISRVCTTSGRSTCPTRY